MWVVCKLVADRSAEPKKVSGTWANGQTMEGYMYPDKAIPLVEQYGAHKTRDDAVVRLVTEYYPECKDSSIEHLKRLSKEFLTGSLKTHKIIKLKPVELGVEQ